MGGRRRCAPSSTTRSPRSARSARPRTWVLSNHDVVRHATRLAAHRRDPAGPRHRPALDAHAGRTRRACAAPAPRPRSCSRCPARRTSTRARSSACPRSSTCPTTPARTRPGSAPNGETLRPRRMPRADPLGGRRAVARLRPDRGQLAAAARRWAELARDAQHGVAGSTLELYRDALARAPRARARRSGTLEWLPTDDDAVWLPQRRRDGRREHRRRIRPAARGRVLLASGSSPAASCPPTRRCGCSPNRPASAVDRIDAPEPIRSCS